MYGADHSSPKISFRIDDLLPTISSHIKDSSSVVPTSASSVPCHHSHGSLSGRPSAVQDTVCKMTTSSSSAGSYANWWLSGFGAHAGLPYPRWLYNAGNTLRNDLYHEAALIMPTPGMITITKHRPLFAQVVMLLRYFINNYHSILP